VHLPWKVRWYASRVRGIILPVPRRAYDRGRARKLIVRCPVMRLWTFHPKYLDARGLVALWREGLLARAVLKRETKGYRHHPQLARFRAHRSPTAAINAYLRTVLVEAEARGYAFDRKKLGPLRRGLRLRATQGQVAYERRHLLHKLLVRSPRLYGVQRRIAAFEPNPLFKIVPGGVEAWERKRVAAPTKRLARPRKPGRRTVHAVLIVRGRRAAAARGRPPARR
jgi:hypothetical protein